jgi:3-oxoacyl-[acyl-carrier protein] reductase
MTKEQYDRFFSGRGPEHVAPVVAYLATDESYYINGQIFHAEKGRISTYIFGDDSKFLYNDGAVFTVDELIQKVPESLMNGVVPVVPVVKLEEAVKASEARKAS